jgi:hypothetical protein
MTVAPEKPKAKGTSKKLLYIHFADGNKGGVGKSFFCRTLYQWFLDKGVGICGVEADINSPDFKGIYKEVEVTRFSEDEHLNGQANRIVNWAIDEQKHLVVNLPATVHSAFKLWLNSYDIVNLAAENGVGLVKWFVCTGEFDSMKSLAVSLREFGRTVPHVVVRNQKYLEWDDFNEDQELQALIKEFNCQVIDLPKLPPRVANTLLQRRITLGEGKEYKGDRFGIVEQAAIKGYLRNSYAAFESTGWLPQ